VTITVKELRPVPTAGNLKGFAVVEVGPWTIRGCRIIQQLGQRPYVALPQEKTADGRYFPILQTNDTSLKDTIQAAVLQAWSRGHGHTAD
jgi:DNA-binding cell septation regulator SpoVG